MDSQTVWERIMAHVGEEFRTKRGIRCTYHIRNYQLILENTNRYIPYSNFEQHCLYLILISQNLRDSIYKDHHIATGLLQMKEFVNSLDLM